MDEAAPQAATGKTAVAQAHEVLRLEWGQWHQIGQDAVRTWWAQRRDGPGGGITAETPHELRTAIYEDHTLKPVPAQVVAPASPAGDTP